MTRPRRTAPRRTAAAAALALVASAPRAARGQDGAVSASCFDARVDPSPISVLTADACQKAADLFLFLSPQIGAVVAGGNPDPGQGGTVGGIGRFGASLRVNALRGRVPRFDDVTLSPTGARRSDFRTSSTPLAFPEADVALGIFRGLPVGVTSVGGVDLLLNAAYVPTVTRDEVAVRTGGGSLRVGYGVRVGVLQETLVVPGVSVSLLRRETPRVDVDARTGNDTVGARGLRVRSDSWRLTASKGLVLVRAAVGVGQDRIDARAALDAVVNEGPLRVTSRDNTFSARLTRTNYFANLTFGRIPFAALVGEIGRTSGGSLPATFNDFDGRRPDAAYTYGSVALRVGR